MSDRHTLPDYPSMERYAPGTVYAGHWTRHIYRVAVHPIDTAVLLRHSSPWLDGQGRHRVQDDVPEWEKGATCAMLARGFCPAAVDDYCVGGQINGRCHG